MRIRNGQPIAGATTASYQVSRAAASDAGIHTLQAINALGTTTSNAVTVTVLLPQLTNLSVRSTAGSGDQTLIGGFVISGVGQKQALIRGIGPSLAQSGVNGVLQNPRLQLYNGATLLAENDNWGGTASVASAFTQVGAFGLASTSLDAALVISVQPGTYTAQVSGVASSTGVALLEVYDVP